MATPRHLVTFDADAAIELASVQSKAERKAIYATVAKLRVLGEQLTPPHMKPLQGRAARTLRELRPRRGDSPWRLIYRRRGEGYVVLAVAHKDDFDATVQRAAERALWHVELDSR